MRRFFCLLALLALAGCGQPPAANEQQTELARLAEAGGYMIGGMSQYEEDRWTINVNVEGCSADIKLGGEKAPETNPPTQYEVLEIAGEPLTNLSPNTNGRNLPAPGLRGVPALDKKLDCKTSTPSE